MSLVARYLAIFAIVALQLGGLSYFALGFFPKKIVLPGRATYQPDADHGFPEKVFNKMVFVVIDAMRRYDSTLGFFNYLANAIFQ